MNDDETPSTRDGEPLVRPFMFRGQGGPTGALPAHDGSRRDVRPYLVTGGRTSASPNVGVAMETIVMRSDLARGGRSSQVEFERTAVLAECEQPCSVAEVAARVGLPLMVALVLVGDLVGEGLLEASWAAPRQADDIAFLERLIHGVRAL